jgi:hypothetical protein
MERVRLIHWDAVEAAERAERLSTCGYEVDHELTLGPALIRGLAGNPPAAIIIDLSRLPSQGRDVGLLLRKRKATRDVPLVFVGGDPAKVSRIRGLLPDASYASWEQIGESLREAIRRPPADPVVPDSQFAAYAGKPLVDTLRIKPHSVVRRANAPAGLLRHMG